MKRDRQGHKGIRDHKVSQVLTECKGYRVSQVLRAYQDRKANKDLLDLVVRMSKLESML